MLVSPPSNKISSRMYSGLLALSLCPSHFLSFVTFPPDFILMLGTRKEKQSVDKSRKLQKEEGEGSKDEKEGRKEGGSVTFDDLSVSFPFVGSFVLGSPPPFSPSSSGPSALLSIHLPSDLRRSSSFLAGLLVCSSSRRIDSQP
mmetsp:Transcript_13886/g.27728  ORF Transcript_13886/g.27728 Transcript_13886/m.27728 type:complete len:144 (+) Transcript_13886:297-728(+)